MTYDTPTADQIAAILAKSKPRVGIQNSDRENWKAREATIRLAAQVEPVEAPLTRRQWKQREETVRADIRDQRRAKIIACLEDIKPRRAYAKEIYAAIPEHGNTALMADLIFLRNTGAIQCWPAASVVRTNYRRYWL